MTASCVALRHVETSALAPLKDSLTARCAPGVRMRVTEDVVEEAAVHALVSGKAGQIGKDRLMAIMPPEGLLTEIHLPLKLGNAPAMKPGRSSPSCSGASSPHRSGSHDARISQSANLLKLINS